MDRRLERWRLVLGGGAAEGTGARLNDRHQAMDDCLAALYDAPSGGTKRRGGLAGSAPRVSRWLGDVRRLFAAGNVQVLQKDALERLGLGQMLLEPELLGAVEPDVELAATLLSLREMVPDRSREAVRGVVREVARRLREQLELPLAGAVRGERLRALPTRRPRPGEVDFPATIRANLKRYEPALGTILPVELRGRRRVRGRVQEVMLLVDQSASMASSLVHACVAASVLASVPAVRTRLAVFDTAVVDLSDHLGDDPVDVLFGVELGGGTDIERALEYARRQIQRPRDAVLVLVSDLFEGGDPAGVVARVRALVAAGTRVLVLLALDDDGSPAHDEDLAQALAAEGAPVLACPPRRFPELVGAALAGRDPGVFA